MGKLRRSAYSVDLGFVFCHEAEVGSGMKSSKFFLVVAAVAAGFSFFGSQDAGAYCQIPCGIYDDAARFVTMREHVATIKKSMDSINELAKDRSGRGGSANQLIRWVANKETHADELSEIVTYYFLSQRIKVPANFGDELAVKKYLADMALLHQILVYSMKAKQTTDPANTEKLLELIAKFEVSYMGKKGASVEQKKLPYTKRLATLRG